MKRILNKLSALIIVIVAIAMWCLYSYEQSEASSLASSQALSNNKIGWGVKRAENHAQPDLRKNKHRINGKI